MLVSFDELTDIAVREEITTLGPKKDALSRVKSRAWGIEKSTDFRNQHLLDSAHARLRNRLRHRVYRLRHRRVGRRRAQSASGLAGRRQAFACRKKDPLPQRLALVYTTLLTLLETHQPDIVAIEEVFYSVNAKSALKLGQVRGVALLAAATAGSAHCRVCSPQNQVHRHWLRSRAKGAGPVHGGPPAQPGLCCPSRPMRQTLSLSPSATSTTPRHSRFRQPIYKSCSPPQPLSLSPCPRRPRLRRLQARRLPSHSRTHSSIPRPTLCSSAKTAPVTINQLRAPPPRPTLSTASQALPSPATSKFVTPCSLPFSRPPARIASLPSPCEAPGSHVAFTGKKTVSYTGPDGHGECTYNWSRDQQLNQLADDLMAIAYTIDEGRRLATEHVHSRLSLDAELEALQDAAKDRRALEIENISSELESIANDEAVMNRARNRARALLSGSAKH